MNGMERDFVGEALDSNWIAPLGPQVDAFEVEVAGVVGAKCAAALSSGTAALHLAIKAAGVGAGDVVFCSDVTFAASCNPIKYENAVPVFIDSEADSWNMCPGALLRAFKKYPGTKAVIVVNLYGTPAKLDVIADICRAHKAVLIEDAAESLGSVFNGRQTASFGDISVLSFNGNKIITTSGGGMLLSNDAAIVEKAKFWATQARDKALHYEHSELGYNYRLSNICAAIGRAQLKTLDLRVAQKTNIYNTYAAAFAAHPEIHLNPIPNNCISNHWLTCITLTSGDPIRLITQMAAQNIECRPIWKPMSLQPYYNNCDLISTTNAPIGHALFAKGLCLPSDVKMTKDEQAKVCALILKSL